MSFKQTQVQAAARTTAQATVRRSLPAAAWRVVTVDDGRDKSSDVDVHSFQAIYDAYYTEVARWIRALVVPPPIRTTSFKRCSWSSTGACTTSTAATSRAGSIASPRTRCATTGGWSGSSTSSVEASRCRRRSPRPDQRRSSGEVLKENPQAVQNGMLRP